MYNESIKLFPKYKISEFKSQHISITIPFDRLNYKLYVIDLLLLFIKLLHLLLSLNLNIYPVAYITKHLWQHGTL